MSVLTALIVVTCFIWEWPTLYRYDHITSGSGASYPVKINRFTGQTYVLYQNGWELASKPSKAEPPETELPPEELAKLTSEASLKGGSLLTVKIYNGSRYKVNEITVLVSYRYKFIEVWRRPYRIQKEYGTWPEKTSSFDTDLGADIGKDDTWDWKITSAKGFVTDQIPSYVPPSPKSSKLKFSLSDPEFWAMPLDSQRYVIEVEDWSFAEKSEEEQIAWLKGRYEEFLRGKTK